MEDSAMNTTRLLAVCAALSVTVPAWSARADCSTPEGRDIIHLKYRQAMAAWSQSNPQGYADAQDQLKADLATAQHASAEQRDQKQCAMWQRYITLSKK
jgi:hypothetical protein